MILWSDFIAEMTKYVLTKIEDKHPAFSNHQKKEAGRHFYNWYLSIEQLELLTHELIKLISPVVRGEKSRIYHHWIGSLDKRVESGTEKFRSSFLELKPILGWYEPNLHLLFSQFGSLKGIRIYRKRLLQTEAFEQMRFCFTLEGNKFVSIDYTLPHKEWGGIDFGEVFQEFRNLDFGKITDFRYYSEKRNDETLFINQLTATYDPIAEKMRDNFSAESVKPDEIEKIQQLNQALSEQVEGFSIARQVLGNFIQDAFRLSDLLDV